MDIVVDPIRRKIHWSYEGDCPSFDIFEATLEGDSLRIVKNFTETSTSGGLSETDEVSFRSRR